MGNMALISIWFVLGVKLNGKLALFQIVPQKGKHKIWYGHVTRTQYVVFASIGGNGRGRGRGRVWAGAGQNRTYVLNRGRGKTEHMY